MLAPLDWHGYKRKYGKHDDFVAGHPELFLIGGDYIQLREGAQETIAPTAAVAKVAAASKTSPSLYSSMLPSVTVTPMSQSYRLKSNHSSDSVHSQLADGYANVKILSKELSHGSSVTNSIGKHRDRRNGVASNPRR